MDSWRSVNEMRIGERFAIVLHSQWTGTAGIA